MPLADVVETFVRHLKDKAEAFAGQEITSVVHGRPVRFVDGDERADARAQEMLEAIARRAGFRDIAFVYEPIAAAYHYERTVQTEELVLIADIGGGTSDFSVVRIGPHRRERAERGGDVLANAGVRLGGTDFDRALNLATVMPLLGLGTHLVEKLPSAQLLRESPPLYARCERDLAVAMRLSATGVARRQLSPPLHRQAGEMHAGIDDQELAGDVGGAGQEEQHRLGHLLGRAGLAQRRGLLLASASACCSSPRPCRPAASASG